MTNSLPPGGGYSVPEAIPYDKNPWRIKPSFGYVLVEQQTEERTTAAGLVLPFAQEKDTHICQVIDICDPYEAAVGDRTFQREGPVYALGDLVIIGKWQGREIVMDRKKYLLIREQDVVAVLEKR